MPEPAAVLEKMLSWTKPGGMVAAQGFDFGGIAVEPLCPAVTAFNRLFEGVHRGHGRTRRAGRQLPPAIRSGWIVRPDGTTADVKFIPLKDMASTLNGIYQGLLAAVMGLGIADQARAAAFRYDMKQAAEDGRYDCLTPIIVGTWKRVS